MLVDGDARGLGGSDQSRVRDAPMPWARRGVAESDATRSLPRCSPPSPGVLPTQCVHLHIGGDGECPGQDVAGDDGLISTAEGQPAYGPVMVSLTTEGAVDKASALAVERFPVASADGAVAYEPQRLPEKRSKKLVALTICFRTGRSQLRRSLI